MPSLTSPVLFDADLLHKYNQPLPRYTSYPPATELRQQVDQEDVAAAIALGNYQQTPISLYCHIPFCESACYFCGCNTVRILTSQPNSRDAPRYHGLALQS